MCAFDRMHDRSGSAKPDNSAPHGSPQAPTSSARKSIAVLVLNWNGANWLRRSLPSIQRAAARVNADVVVVDNRSDDASAAVCADEFPAVHFERMPQNLVLVSYNVIAATLPHDLLVFLNNDLEVADDCFERMARWFDR